MAPTICLPALLLLPWVIPCLSVLITITSDGLWPDHVVNSSTQGNITAVIPLLEVDHHWVANVSIGGQPVLLCVDTGSSPLWVTSPQAAINQSRSYSPQKSPRSRSYRNETFLESFPSGSASGILVEDSVILGNGSVKLHNFTFGYVDQRSAGIKSQPFDGFLGLGLSNRSTNRTILDSKPTFFQSLMPNLNAPIFSMDLRPTANGSIPSMTLGATNASKFRGNLTQVPIDTSSYRWLTNGVIFGVHGSLLNESANLVFDTGGDNYINAPFSVVQEYYSQLKTVFWGSQLGGFDCTIIIPCDSVLPDLQMKIGNSTAMIRSDFMRGRLLTGPADPSWGGGQNGLCIPGLQPFGRYPGKSCRNLGLIGAPFFYENYVVFNQVEPAVFYAPYA